MAATRTESFLSHYLQYFGEAKHSFVDLYPDGIVGEHLPLDEKYKMPASTVVENFDKYVHPCWCNAELIYADDKRGNEVWLHKREQ